ncbi:B-box domain protein [Actinidia chinensis var. chinensis]|uniref:B-box domain protein n=1 Tax=Actinidia chinensis var. chinensis TaxID=1590841 RepID=A0A2R6QTH7_ACTCC|nr:B-box domain protein [Actinidia chinensis var. chinensis]
MCRGREEEPSQEGCFKRTEALKEAVSGYATVACELCESWALLYCQADNAFLCRKCDKSVHGANFLARRHIRCLLCNTCQGLTQRYLIGTSFEVLLPTIVSWGERSRCNSNVKTKYSKALKTPFLFL